MISFNISLDMKDQMYADVQYNYVYRNSLAALIIFSWASALDLTCSTEKNKSNLKFKTENLLKIKHQINGV